MPVPTWSPETFLTTVPVSPVLVVRIASGDGKFSPTLERRLHEHRLFRPLALGTVDRGLYDSNNPSHEAFLAQVRDRESWNRSVTLPKDGYYLFLNGAYVAFHPLLVTETDPSAWKVKLVGAALLGLGGGMPAALESLQMEGNEVADYFIKQMDRLNAA